MNRYTIVALCTLLILSCSCSSRRSKAGHKDIIPERDLIMILTDVHLADGLLNVGETRKLYSSDDDLSIYREIFEGYGYSEEIMDKTLRFYFMKRPKKLVRIYDRVLGRLSVMEARLEHETPLHAKRDESSLWDGESIYWLPPGRENDTAWFEFPIISPGRYTLTFHMTIYPDDETIDPVCGIFISPADTLQPEKRDYFATIPFLKDGQTRYYRLTKRVTGDQPQMIKGWFVNYENQRPATRHMRVENIYMIRNLPRQ